MRRLILLLTFLTKLTAEALLSLGPQAGEVKQIIAGIKCWNERYFS